MNIVTRFAPSPTGYLHLGNLRTALYAWLFARSNNGEFLLRIEDTDLKRSKKKFIDNIFFVLDWLGLYWDKEPYYQSKNIDLYKDKINYLLVNNLAYKCYCSNERLNEIRKLCLNKKKKPKYDGFCRNIINNNNYKSYVIRFKNPLKGKIIFNDIIFNNIKFWNKELDDFIILRKNGMPTYNFCSVIDDSIMLISHVIRGADHINNTPRQINLINSLNFKKPKYVHLPIILNKNKKKLSKRNCNYDINNYIKEGFLPESLINGLLRLGWSYKNIELINCKDIIKIFDLKYINNSPCIINKKKLIWINKQYINKISYEKLIFYLKPLFIKNNLDLNKIKNINEIIFVIINRIYVLKEIVDFYILLQRKFNISKDIFHKYKYIDIKKIIDYFLDKLFKVSFWSFQNINNVIKQSFNDLICFNKFMIYKILRIYLIGIEMGLSVNFLIFILKKNEVLYRLKRFYNI